MRGSSMLAGLATIVVAGAAVAAGAAEPAGGSPPPPVVEKIVQRFVADNSGIMVWRQRAVYDQDPPSADAHNEQDFGVLQQARITLAVRLHRVITNGRVRTAAELAMLQSGLDERYLGMQPRIITRFSMPYYPESAADYTFSAPKPCAGCTGGAQIVDFTSTANDERHLHGSMTFDPATARPMKLQFAPYVFPATANAGTVTYTYGRYDDGGWGVVRIDEHYSGRAGQISGTRATTTIQHARHYPTLEEARKALEAEGSPAAGALGH